MGGAAHGDRPASPLPRCCFGCWRSLRSCGRRRPVYPQGKGREIPGGNQRRRSAAGTFPAPQAPTKEGLDRPERTRTIRQDSSQNVADKTGPGGPELCDGTPWTQQPAAPADAHQLVDAQRQPGLLCMGEGAHKMRSELNPLHSTVRPRRPLLTGRVHLDRGLVNPSAALRLANPEYLKASPCGDLSVDGSQ